MKQDLNNQERLTIALLYFVQFLFAAVIIIIIAQFKEEKKPPKRKEIPHFKTITNEPDSDYMERLYWYDSSYSCFL
jgi:hypothetical protein